MKTPPNVPEAIANRSHFTVERWGAGYAVTIYRRGRQPLATTCLTLGEVNRLRRELSDQGLPGFNRGAA